MASPQAPSIAPSTRSRSTPRPMTRRHSDGKRDVTGTHAHVRWLNQPAHEGRTYRDSVCIHEATGAGSLSCGGETHRVGQWMDMKLTRKIDGHKIAAGSERIADPRRWPAL